MLDRLPHRGPDDVGLHETSDAVFGHTRLSIVDVKKGRQPILADAGAAGIVCNGEIYNYRPLRRQLGDRYDFTTDSDTEVALHAYRAEGPRFVQNLDGMFALAAFDHGNYVNDEIQRCLKSLHNINLQRADRMGMMFSLELRVPFLDTSLIELCSRIDPDMKIRHDPAGADIEKWILRKAFSGTGYLPDDIIWRYKVQYTQGAGCESIGEVIAEEELSDTDYARLVAEYPDAELNSKEAAYYFSLFNEHFPHKSSRHTVGIWSGFAFPEERRPVSGTLDGPTKH
ncbi:MAG: asparagine synthase-related protein [Planctomycetota bacterium]